MALLDTLKKGISTVGNTVLGAAAPAASAIKNTASSLINTARSAASLAPTPTDPNKLFSSTGGANSLKNDTTFTVPTGGTMQTVSKSPSPTISQSNPINRSSDIGVPQIGSNSVARAVTTTNPATTVTGTSKPPSTPAVTASTNPNFNFAPVTYSPQTQSMINASNAQNAQSAQNTQNTQSAPYQTSDNIQRQTELPAQNNELSALEKAILGTYSQSEGERNAQDALSRLAQQQADLSGAFRQGTNKIGEQPIVLGLLRGQQQALENQYNAQQGALADQSKPLEVQLANLQAQRESQNKALSAQYGFESERMKQAREDAAAKAAANKPIEVGGNLIRLNPDTGKFEVVYQAPTKAEDNGFTLGEGQMRFDANGKLIASGGAKSDTGSNPASYKEWQLAGSPGTYLDYLKGGANGNSGRGLTAAQSETLAEAQNLTSSVLGPIYGLIQNSSNLFGPVAGRLGGANPYAAESQGALANLNNAAQLVGSYLEGGKLAEGDIGRYRTMLPQLTDTPAVAKSKLDSVAKLIQDKQAQYLQSYGQAGFNTSGYTSGSSQSITPQALMQHGVSQATIDAYTKAGLSPAEIAQDLGISFNNAPSKALNGSIGGLSAKYESGGNPGAIGYDSTGGYSYGTYQLAHNNAQKFVEESPYAKQFAGIPFNSPQFQQKWKQVAQQDPQGFAQAQHDYIAKTHLEPILNRIKSTGIDVSKMSPVIQDVIWSTAVQHGPNNKIIEQALASANDEQNFIRKVYQLRWNNGAGFASSTPAVKQSVYNRFFGPNGELANALAQSV